MQVEIVVYGGGGHGKAVIELARACGYHVAALVDDRLPAGTLVLDAPVRGRADCLAALRAEGLALAANAVGGIGNPALRAKVFERLAAEGFSFPALVHPRAFVEPSAQIEPGAQVLALAYIGSAARIGFGSVINAGAIVSNDCALGRITNLSPGAALAGGVQIGDLSQVGMNATVNVNLSVGVNCIIGNAAAVKADVPAGTRIRAGEPWPSRLPHQKLPDQG